MCYLQDENKERFTHSDEKRARVEKFYLNIQEKEDHDNSIEEGIALKDAMVFQQVEVERGDMDDVDDMFPDLINKALRQTYKKGGLQRTSLKKDLNDVICFH